MLAETEHALHNSVQVSGQLTNVRSFPSGPGTLITPFHVLPQHFLTQDIFCLDMMVVQCNQLLWFTFLYTYYLSLVRTTLSYWITTAFELLLCL